MFWNSIPEKVRYLEKSVKYLGKVYYHPGNSRETQITAGCWVLAQAYQAMFNASQHPQGEERVSGHDSKMINVVATSTETTGTAAQLVRDDEAGPS